MAKIVLGMASSHAPQLAMPPDQWRAYGDRSRTRDGHWYQGKTYTFSELLDARAEEHLERECTEEKFQARFDACQKAISHLEETLTRIAPDVCVMFGDDQHEVFTEDHVPSIAVYHGATVDDAPREGGFSDATLDKRPSERISHPGEADFGQYLIESLTTAEFDVTRMNVLPPDHNNGAIGHAFYYIYRRLVNNKALPHVPIMVNTYYPPNAPTANRCYKLGQALRQAIEAWDSNKRVALVASGGLSHTVIEEELRHPHPGWPPRRRFGETDRLSGCAVPGWHIGDQELDRPCRSNVRDQPPAKHR